MQALFIWAESQARIVTALDYQQLIDSRDRLLRDDQSRNNEEDLKIIITLGMISIRLDELAKIQIPMQSLPPTGFKDLFQL